MQDEPVTLSSSVSARFARYGVELLSFGLKNARACLFPGFIFTMLALSQLLPLPIARYDFMLFACLAMQLVMLATGLETLDELKTITLFHLLGLGLELFKVHAGSWSYPEDALFKFWGVPLYSGFMYASVASFMIQAWRLLGLRFLRWPRSRLVVPLGALIYLNFFSHHFLPDLRYLLIAAVLVVFVWFAENIATFFGAWQYPTQVDGWHLVSLHKISSWSLLVIVSMMAVVQLKRVKGSRPGESQDVVVR